MFLGFFYLLRTCGLAVSLDEWLGFIESLDKGMADNSLVEFYYLGKNVLVKRESDYDKYDLAFAEFFQGIRSVEEIPEELMEWLATDELERNMNDMPGWADEHDLDELRRMFEERRAEQTEKHDGGNYWIGTGGTSPMGHGGYNPAGIRVGGYGRHRSAVQIAGERTFRDFRQDNELDTRSFQMAFRKLRQFSTRVDSDKTELDIEETIDATCNNAGLLKLVYEKPRKNTVKLLLLMDSDGSMRRYSDICSRLFQAVNESTHLKDLKIYYFHNCIYDHLYTDPACVNGRWVETKSTLANLDETYMTIIVGDAAMSSYELTAPGGNIDWYAYNEEPGLSWLKGIRQRYARSIWLNPISRSRWDYAWGRRTIAMIGSVFPMFELSLDGIDAGIRKLLNR